MEMVGLSGNDATARLSAIAIGDKTFPEFKGTLPLLESFRVGFRDAFTSGLSARRRLNDLGSLLPDESPQSLTLIRIVANCCELAKVANEPGRSGNRCHLIDRRSSHPHDYLAHKHIHARNERLNVDPLRARPLPRQTADPLCAKTFRTRNTYRYAPLSASSTTDTPNFRFIPDDSR